MICLLGDEGLEIPVDVLSVVDFGADAASCSICASRVMPI